MPEDALRAPSTETYRSRDGLIEDFLTTLATGLPVSALPSSPRKFLGIISPKELRAFDRYVNRCKLIIGPVIRDEKRARTLEVFMELMFATGDVP